MIPFQFKVDIFEEIKRVVEAKHEIYVTEGVIRELNSMSKAKGMKGRFAREAVKLAGGLKRISSGMLDVDEELVTLSSKDVLICTNDKALKERIRKKKAPVIYLKQKKYLAIEGYLN